MYEPPSLTHIYTHTQIYTCIYLSMYTYICIHVCTYTHLYIISTLLYIYIYICVFIHSMHIYKYIYVYINIYAHTHILTYLYIHKRTNPHPASHIYFQTHVCIHTNHTPTFDFFESRAIHQKKKGMGVRFPALWARIRLSSGDPLGVKGNGSYQVEQLLTRQLNTRLTVYNDCRPDFWEKFQRCNGQGPICCARGSDFRQVCVFIYIYTSKSWTYVFIHLSPESYTPNPKR